MRSWVTTMWVVGLLVAFAETQRSSMHMQYTQDQYCSSSILRKTTVLTDLGCAGQCVGEAQCVAYSRRGSQCVLHDGFCSSSNLLSETGARYAEVQWECFGSSCYYTPTLRTPRYKASAQADCEKLGAHVLAIETAEEAELVQHFLSGTDTVWLDLEHDGTSWVQGGELVTYFQWFSTEPNDNGPCARLHQGTWYDGGCTISLAFVCEK